MAGAQISVLVHMIGIEPEHLYRNIFYRIAAIYNAQELIK